MRISSVWKAVVSGAAAGTAATATAVQDGRLDVGDVVTILVAILASYGVTWVVPNRSAP